MTVFGRNMCFSNNVYLKTVENVCKNYKDSDIKVKNFSHIMCFSNVHRLTEVQLMFLKIDVEDIKMEDTK
jgi:hypothetical protein